jgi:hypothetical protein
LHGIPLETHKSALPLHFMGLARQYFGLTAVDDNLTYDRKELQEADNDEQSVECYELPLYLRIIMGCGCTYRCGWMLVLGKRGWRRLGWLSIVLSCLCLMGDMGTFASGRPFAFWRFLWLSGDYDARDCYESQVSHG